MTPIADFQTLVQRAREGDGPSLGLLLESAAGGVRCWVRREVDAGLTGRVDADDLVQDTFLRATQAIRGFRGKSERTFELWLCALARRALQDQLRRRWREESHLGRKVSLMPVFNAEGESQDELSSSLEADDSSPLQLLRREERFVRLKKAILRLHPDHRRVLLLTRLEGLPVNEAARRMGRTVGATSMLLSRALTRLRELSKRTDSCHLPPRNIVDELNASR